MTEQTGRERGDCDQGDPGPLSSTMRDPIKAPFAGLIQWRSVLSCGKRRIQQRIKAPNRRRAWRRRLHEVRRLEWVVYAGSPFGVSTVRCATGAIDAVCMYLLHDGRAVVYVGRTTDQPLGVRLKQHTADRLNGRWDRFTWFGVYPVSEEGTLRTASIGSFNVEMLIVTMEALLIEGLEPPQNRKRGDDFRAVEFLQVEDPEIQRRQIVNLMDALKAKL